MKKSVLACAKKKQSVDLCHTLLIYDAMLLVVRETATCLTALMMAAVS